MAPVFALLLINMDNQLIQSQIQVWNMFFMVLQTMDSITYQPSFQLMFLSWQMGLPSKVRIFQLMRRRMQMLKPMWLLFLLTTKLDFIHLN